MEGFTYQDNLLQTREDKLKFIADRYGLYHQLGKLNEECNELPVVTGSSPMEISSKTNMSYKSVIEIFSRAKKNGGVLDGREYRVFDFVGAR